MSRCKSCNEEFESGFGFDAFFCDEWCARSNEPQSVIKPLQLALLEQREQVEQRSKFSKLFGFYFNAFKNRGRNPDEVEVEERILHTEEYIRLRLKFQANEITVTGLKRV